MNLEQRFTKKGTALNGPITKYNYESKVVPMTVTDSTLDFNGVTPNTPFKPKQTTIGLQKSQLDLNGETPFNSYVNNLPERNISLRAIDLVK